MRSAFRLRSASGSAPGRVDGFSRADGPLGVGWTDHAEGALTIVSGQVAGGADAGVTGAIRAAEAYTDDQYSQVTVTATQLSGGQWVGVTVRAQTAGADAYLGIYYWANGTPQLILYRRSGGTFTQLGDPYPCGALPAGTRLKVAAVGGDITFLLDDVQRIAVTDATPLTGGAPGLIAFGTGVMDDWSGGVVTFDVRSLGVDGNGVETYTVLSPMNGPGAPPLRVLRPTSPAAGVAHRILYALPVEAGAGTTFGDPVETLRSLDAHNQYNLTVVAPGTSIESWGADNPLNPAVRHESYLVNQVVPWAAANLGAGEQWLLGFSKSGMAVQGLLLRNPTVFDRAASWDFPADMNVFDLYGTSSAYSYGTDANFQANYRLTSDFLTSHRTGFTAATRLWIGGWKVFQQDIADYDAALTAAGILHATATPVEMDHVWGSGWVPTALTALHTMAGG